MWETLDFELLLLVPTSPCFVDSEPVSFLWLSGIDPAPLLILLHHTSFQQCSLRTSTISWSKCQMKEMISSKISKTNPRSLNLHALYFFQSNKTRIVVSRWLNTRLAGPSCPSRIIFCPDFSRKPDCYHSQNLTYRCHNFFAFPPILEVKKNFNRDSSNSSRPRNSRSWIPPHSRRRRESPISQCHGNWPPSQHQCPEC